MNKRDQLVADTLGEPQGAEFARLAAAQVRRRRLIRHLAAGAGAVGALAVVSFLSRPQSPAPVVELIVGPRAPAMEIMSDQELLAQLKDQPVLILKNDNRITGVVFLDTGTKL